MVRSQMREIDFWETEEKTLRRKKKSLRTTIWKSTSLKHSTEAVTILQLKLQGILSNLHVSTDEPQLEDKGPF